MTFQIFIAVGIGYLLGSIQSAYLVSKMYGKIDIREHGSGNAGASNITTIMGWKYGVAVAFTDSLKGAVAVWLMKAIFPAEPSLAYLAGIAAILGHIFPFYLKFRGGKGVATLVGMVFGLKFGLGFVFIGLVLIPGLLADYIVVGSFAAFIGLPVLTWLMGYESYLIVLASLMVLLVFYLHRGNIQRILAKEETKISDVLKKKKS
jgi:glycerol-3-phosphate acyltransferase PlsY